MSSQSSEGRLENGDQHFHQLIDFSLASPESPEFPPIPPRTESSQNPPAVPNIHNNCLDYGAYRLPSQPSPCPVSAFPPEVVGTPAAFNEDGDYSPMCFTAAVFCLFTHFIAFWVVLIPEIHGRLLVGLLSFFVFVVCQLSYALALRPLMCWRPQQKVLSDQKLYNQIHRAVDVFEIVFLTVLCLSNGGGFKHCLKVDAFFIVLAIVHAYVCDQKNHYSIRFADEYVTYWQALRLM